MTKPVWVPVPCLVIFSQVYSNFFPLILNFGIFEQVVKEVLDEDTSLLIKESAVFNRLDDWYLGFLSSKAAHILASIGVVEFMFFATNSWMSFDDWCFHGTLALSWFVHFLKLFWFFSFHAASYRQFDRDILTISSVFWKAFPIALTEALW